MKKITFLFILFFGFKAVAQYSNATLEGPWLAYIKPLTGTKDSLDFLVFDGAGKILAGSMHGVVKGTYSVSSIGVLSGELIIDVDTIPFGGKFSSVNLLGMGDMEMKRIMDRGALQDTIAGTLSTPNYGSRNVMFILNEQGEIIKSNGLIEPVSGRLYEESGVFIGKVKSGEPNNWHEFGFAGYYSNDSLVGQVTVDAENNDLRTGPALLKRTGKAGTASLESLKKELIGFVLTPNPTCNFITLQLTNEQFQDAAVIQIFDLNGQLVKSEKVLSVQQQFNVSDLKSGSYLVTLQNARTIYKQKLLIQK